MKVFASFYLGVSEYLSDNVKLTKTMSEELKRTELLYNLCISEEAVAEINGPSFQAVGITFDFDFASDDNDPGLPLAAYVEYVFNVPEDKERLVLRNAGDLGEILTATLYAGAEDLHASNFGIRDE